MEKIRKAFNGDWKCRIPAEYTISQFEIRMLRNHPIGGVAGIEGKGDELTYSLRGFKTLSQEMSAGFPAEKLAVIAGQVTHVCIELDKLGLRREKLVLNPSLIFVDPDDGRYQFMYYPVNGDSISFDPVLFLQDLVLCVEQKKDQQMEWQKWCLSAKNEGFEKARCKIPGPKEPCTDNNTSPDWGRSVVTQLDDVGEAPTSSDQLDEEWFSGAFDKSTPNNSGRWQHSSAAPPLDDDDDAPTDSEDLGVSSDPWGSNAIYGDKADQFDGTYVESPSQYNHNSQRFPKIKRISSGESKEVHTAEFKMGKSEMRADFCIRGNEKISNVHAVILRQGNHYYLKDSDSKNGTFFNGRKLLPSEAPVRLTDRCRFRLFNEEFEFTQ